MIFSTFIHLGDLFFGHASHEGLLNPTRVHWISRGFTESHEGLNISRVGITSWDVKKTKPGYHRFTRESQREPERARESQRGPERARVSQTASQRGWPHILSMCQHYFVAKQVNTTLFCCETLNYSTFSRETLKYGTYFSEWFSSNRVPHWGENRAGRIFLLRKWRVCLRPPILPSLT